MKSPKEALRRLCNPVHEVSAHYFIEQGGAVTQLVAKRSVLGMLVLDAGEIVVTSILLRLALNCVILVLNHFLNRRY